MTVSRCRMLGLAEGALDDLDVGQAVVDQEDVEFRVHGGSRPASPAAPSGTPGSVTKKVEPRPGSLSTQIRPPWAWAIFWQMASPAPVPSYSSRVWRRRKSWKILAWNWGSMPIPLSRTHRVTRRPGPSSSAPMIDRGVGPRVVLQAVADEVRQELADPVAVAPDRRERALDPDLGLPGPDQLGEVGPDHLDDLVQRDHGELAGHLAGAGEREQVLDQGPEPPRRLDQVADVLLAGVVEPVALVAHQEVGEGDQGPERLLEVVGDDVGELVQLLVLARELGVGRGQPRRS